MNFKVSQLKSLTAGEVAVDDLIYVIDSNPTDGSVKSKKVTVGDLIDSRIYGISSSQFVLITGYYADPSWITSLDWSKITNAPSFVTSLSALTDVQLSTPLSGQALVYNGSKWVNQGIGELDTLATVTTRGNTTTNSITIGSLTVNGTISGTGPKGVYLNNTLVATANNSALIGLHVDMAGNANGFTGVTGWGVITGSLSGYNLRIHRTQYGIGERLSLNGYNTGTANAQIFIQDISSGGTYIGGGGGEIQLGGGGGKIYTGGGNFLIGTSTDSGFKLDVNGSSRLSGVTTVATGSQRISFNLSQAVYIGLGVNNNQIGANNSNCLFIGSQGDLPIYSLAGGTVIICDLANPASSASAKLRIDSTIQGFLQPRMTNTQAIAITTPATGLQLYDTTNNKNLLYNGTLWQNIATETWVAAQGYLTTAPTLASVTTAGNTTTNSITVGGLTSTLANANVTHVGANSKGFYILNNADSLVRAGLQFNGSTAYVELLGRYQNGAAFIRQDGGTGNISFLRDGSEYLRIFGGTGNTAIGTTTDAGYKLDVNGTARVFGQLEVLSNGTPSAPFGGILLKHTALSTTATQIYYASSNAVTYFDALYNHSGATTFASFDFRSKNSSAALTSRMYIQGWDGNVGFGTTTPVANIHTANSITAASALAQGVYFNNTLVAAANNDVLVGLDINPTFTNGAFTGLTGYGLRVKASLNTINQTDYVASFENTHPLYGNGIQIIGAGDKGGARILLRAANNDGTNVFRILGNGSISVGNGNNNNLGTVIDNNSISLGGYQTISNGNSIGIVFSPFSSSNAVTFRQGGNVLIGTTTDAGYKLDVNGTARIQGVITGSVPAGGSLVLGAASANQRAIYVNGYFTTGGAIVTSNANARSYNFTIGGQENGLIVEYTGNNQPVVGSINRYFSIAGSINTTNGTMDLQGYTFIPTIVSETGATIKAFVSTLSAASNRHNLYLSGSAQNYIEGNVGIGTPTPFGKVDVKDGEIFVTTSTNANLRSRLTYQGLYVSRSSDGGYAEQIISTSSAWQYHSRNSHVFYRDTLPYFSMGGLVVGSFINLNTTGNVLINTSTDNGYKLQVNGNAYLAGSAGTTTLNVDFGNVNSNVKILSHGSSDFSQLQIGTNFSLSRNGGGDPSISTTFGLGIISNSLSLQTSTAAPGKLWIKGNYGLGSAYFGANNSNGVTASTLYFQNSETPTAVQNVLATFNLWGISDNATVPTLPASSMFSLHSTTRGFLKPRLTTTQKNAITSPATGLEVYDSTTNTPNYFNGTTWVGVASNQSTGLSPGLFSQTSDSVAVTNTTVESSLISTGVGTLSVPANGFQVGAAYIAYFSGVMSSQNNATMEIHLRSNGFVLANTDSMILSATTGKFWELHVNFVIRAIGGGGVAAIVTSGRFSYNKNSGNNPESIGFSDVNNTTFDTTINNTLAVTATWGNASPSNSIQTRLFNLYRVY